MGMESFRIDYIYKSTTQSEIVNYLKSIYRIEKNYFNIRNYFVRKKIFMKNEYRIEKYVIAHFDDPTSTLTLEACFSNYENYAFLFYQIYSALKEKFEIEIKFGRDPLISDLDLSSFLKLLNDFYDRKYESFLIKYCINNTDMCPGEFFYKNYRKAK